MRTITQQETRPLTDEELNTISGGMMEAVFIAGNTVVMISADANHYEVNTVGPTFCQTTVGSVGR
jgi:bacteriocin-like protein